MISRTALHTIRALTRLAELEDGEFLGAAALAGSIGAPPNYLGKVLQSLAATGIVEGRKGMGGGFRLAREAGAIRLWDVVEAIDPGSRWEGCFLGRPVCSDDTPCAVHDRWATLRDAYTALLSDTTIEHLIEQSRRAR